MRSGPLVVSVGFVIVGARAHGDEGAAEPALRPLLMEGLDGLGAGYMVASPDSIAATVAAAAEAGLLPVARRAAMVALVDQGYMREYVDTRIATRRWMSRALTDLGFETIELPGPHLFVRGPIPPCLLHHDCTLAMTDGWLWAVGTPEQVEDRVLELQRAGVKVGG